MINFKYNKNKKYYYILFKKKQILICNNLNNMNH